MERERLTVRIKNAAAAKDRKEKKPTTKGDMHRDVEGFEYDKSKAKVLKGALHNINVSLGTLMSAMKQLSMLRGSDITPDGKLGGRGFIMEFREIKQGINKAVGTLSDITDSLADELKNPGWGLKDFELKEVKEEQEEVDEIEDKVEDIADEEPEESQEESDYDSQPEETSLEEESKTEIGPEDVVDAALDRYRELLGNNASDKVASVLGKRVLANMTLSKTNQGNK